MLVYHSLFLVHFSILKNLLAFLEKLITLMKNQILGKYFFEVFLDAISSVLLCQKTAFKALCGYARLAFLRSKAQDLSRNGNVIRMGKKESGQHLV